MEPQHGNVTRDDVASLIGRLATALGGAEELRAARTETVTATGRRMHPGWGTDPAKPELSADFSHTLLQDLVRPRYKLAVKGRTHLVPTELDYTETGNGSAGYLDGVDFMFDPRPVSTTVPSWRVATRQRHLDLTSVLRTVHKLMAPGADVTLEDGSAEGRRQPVLTLREVGRPAVRVHLDEHSLPARITLTEEHPPLGDALVEVLFGDFRSVDALVLPHRVDILVNGTVVHEETRSDIRVGTAVADAEFAVPDATVQDSSAQQSAYTQYSTEWIMTYVYAGVRFYFDLQIAPVTAEPVELAEGVKIVLGPSHNTLVVEMPDHLVAVEAPMYDEYTHAALAQVKAAFPDKPLRRVIGTHFHYDHIGGIREFAAEGDITVIVGQATVPFFTEVFRSPHTVDPDRLQTQPVEVVVQGVTDKLVLPMADGGHLTAHHIASDHSDDMLIVHLSKSKIVFQSDLWNPTPVMPPPNSGRGRLAVQLYEAIVDLGLDVETVVGGHSGTDGKVYAHAAPLSHLRRAAGY